MNIDKICEQLTIDEKIRLLGGVGDWHTYDCNGKIPSIMMTDGPHGIRKLEQEKVGDIETSKPATCFPTASAIACSWNPAIVKKMGEAIAKEAKKEQISIVLGCGINIKRSPLCGRNFEYYSEDPYLSGMLAAAVIRGVQSKSGCGVTIKHFACNNQEDNRMGVDSCVSERALREIYLRGFEIAVKEGNPVSIMTSYNLINGIHAANSKDLCMTVARKEWGFDGAIMSDWNTTVPEDGSVPWKCVAAGNDIIMPGNPDDDKNIRQAYKEGKLTEEEIRNCAGHLVSMIRRLESTDC